jgi:hypothetical protein
MPRKVYRLENEKGNGPFHGDQVCVHYLTPHYDPDKMAKVLSLPDEALEALKMANFVFGWSRLSDYRKFFKRGGQSKCSELGFTQVIYRPELRLDFPDGQVMFSKPNMSIETPYLKLLLKAIKKMTNISR